MKFFSLLLICPLFCLSQTTLERQKIVSTYDKNEVAKLKEKARLFSIEQRLLIEDYKKKHPEYKDSPELSLQRIYNGIPLFFTISNQGSSQTIRTNSLYPGGVLGLNVTGSGIVAGVWDAGKVRNTHQEFTNNRVTLRDNAEELNFHATHVTGTIIGAGTSAVRRGIAYDAQAFTHDWNNDYEEMVTFGSEGYLVSNHSYGYSTNNAPLWLFGQYDNSSIEIDDISNAFPYYQVVIAAGNDRNKGSAQDFGEGGYDLLSGTGTSKNGITVAAVEQVNNYVNSNSVVMSSFSNYGPPDDGRIKPDIAAKGVSVSSATIATDNAYEVLNGTSMAAPAITGMIVLLQKHYNNLNASYMRAATVRGLICHTARETGTYPGPDYEFGWGLADARSAANVISNRGNSTVLEENILSQNETFTKQVQVGTSQRLTATICWTDPTGNQNSSGVNDPRGARLRNNLDIKVLKDGETYYPWRLTYEDPFQPASNDGDNNVDNVERIDIENATPGIYTIQVTHKANLLSNNPQAFSLIVSGSTSGVTLGTGQFDFNKSIVLYPNPTNSILNFAVPNNLEVSQVALYDVLGKQVLSNAQLLNNSLDVSNLSKGIYLVSFTCDGQSVTKKFVKE